jgi:hypothetical protein
MLGRAYRGFGRKVLARMRTRRGFFGATPPIPRMTDMHRQSRRHPWSLAVPLAGCSAVLGVMITPRSAIADDKDDKSAAVAEASPSPVVPPPAPAKTKSRGIPLSVESGGWGVSLYGFVELDTMYDTTRSFDASQTNNTIARPHTYAGDNPREQFTVQNSRFGFEMHAPDVGSVKTSGVLEMDFFGANSSPTENSLYANQILRLRHFYVKLESPVIDVLAGQYHDLYGWGGAGFYPNSVAFLPLLGEIYHRNPQLRLSKTFGGDAVAFEMAIAAVRPVQRDSALPDGQAGIRLALNGFRGAATPGASRPISAPFEVGISAVGRRFSVTDFSQTPGNDHVVYAGGVAGNTFLPIVPAHGPDKEDLSNALTLTVEGSMGSGVSDFSPGLTGGVNFPSLPNPQPLFPVPAYTPNIDPGLVTYDSSDVLHTINWSSVVGNLHYHLPIEDGRRVWISVTGALISSNNAKDLTPLTGQAAVWNKGNYVDGNLWISVTKPILLGLSIQTMAQTFGDGVTARNYRGEGSCYFFF